MGTATLIDGRVVDSASEEWRLETEARAVVAMPTKDARHCYVWGWNDPHSGRRHKGVADVRGDAAARQLEAKVWELWRSMNKGVHADDNEQK